MKFLFLILIFLLKTKKFKKCSSEFFFFEIKEQQILFLFLQSLKFRLSSTNH